MNTTDIKALAEAALRDEWKGEWSLERALKEYEIDGVRETREPALARAVLALLKQLADAQECCGCSASKPESIEAALESLK